MIRRYNVRCGINTPVQELQIDKDTVYKRYNIHICLNSEGEEEYEYDEDELTLVEYFRESVPRDQNLTEETLGELSILFSQYQQEVDKTLAELSILLGEAASNV